MTVSMKGDEMRIARKSWGRVGHGMVMEVGFSK